MVTLIRPGQRIISPPGVRVISGTQAARGAGVDYIAKVLTYSPIAYWPLNETSGTAAVCQVNAAQNGTYARNVTTMGTGTGIGDGGTAPDFDGTNDFVDIFSVTLNSVFNGAEGTINIWAKVSGAGVWTDSTNRTFVRIGSSNTTNYMRILKTTTNSQIQFIRKANNVNEVVNGTSSNTGWLSWSLTWSVGADQVIAYIGGAPVGSPVTSLNAYSGALLNTITCIGSNNTTPNLAWDGYLAHAAVFGSALNSTQIADLATV